MQTVGEILAQRQGDNWLIGAPSDRFWQLFQARSQQYSSFAGAKSTPPLVLIASPNSVDFLADFFAALNQNCDVLLANPAWGKLEWKQVLQRFQPETAPPLSVAAALAGKQRHEAKREPEILIPTGGSSGRLKFVVHTWQTLMVAVQGFLDHFELTQTHAYCVLPLYHVSGLMQVLRAFASGGTLALQMFRELEGGDRQLRHPPNGFISLVPTQLQRLLERGGHTDWLAQFKTVLLGGAPAWPDLIHSARQVKIPLALTYGMTETAAQVATLHPQDFLAGQTHSGRVLPHVQIRIEQRSAQGIGAIAIQTDSLGLAILHIDTAQRQPLAQPNGWFYPDDIGRLDEQSGLHVVGRHSHKIITGGDNVFPEEVEAAIQSTGLVKDVAVVGKRDRHWGEAVVAIYVAKRGVTTAQIQRALKPLLAPYKQPKRWIVKANLPRNAQGKLNRKNL